MSVHIMRKPAPWRDNQGVSKDNDTPSAASRQTGVDRPEPPETQPLTTEEDVARPAEADTSGPAKLKLTRISGTWVAVLVAVVVLVFLLIFILQNSDSATVHYLGLSGTLPLGVALLFASVGGALLVALVGAARILQLRRFARRASNRQRSQSTP